MCTLLQSTTISFVFSIKSNGEIMVMCVNRVLAVLARLAAAALAVLTGYKLIADSRNLNKTSDNKAL